MKPTIFGLLTLSFLTACGDNNKSGGSNEPQVDHFTGLNTLRVNEEVKYESKCIADRNQGVVIHSITRFKLRMTSNQGATMTMTTTVYGDQCNFAQTEQVVDGYGIFLEDNRLFSSTVSAIYLRPLTTQITHFFNRDRACGYTDWRPYTLRNITHTNCVAGDLSGDVYIDSRNRGENVTLFLCKTGQTVSNDCEKHVLHKTI